MRRSKLGDVYSVKLPNGYKLFQRAYDIPRKGRFVRVFDGLYERIPENIGEIVAGPHSYIIGFYASRAYRIGLVQFVENYPVPEEYPFPEYQFKFYQKPSGKYNITVQTIEVTRGRCFEVNSMADLPEEFRDLKLLSPCLSPDLILWLFDTNWSLSNLAGFYPGEPGEDWDIILKPYSDMVDEALANDPLKKKKK